MLNSAKYTGLAQILKQQWPAVTLAIVVEVPDKSENGHDSFLKLIPLVVAAGSDSFSSWQFCTATMDGIAFISFEEFRVSLVS